MLAWLECGGGLDRRFSGAACTGGQNQAEQADAEDRIGVAHRIPSSLLSKNCSGATVCYGKTGIHEVEESVNEPFMCL
jgi:hypothetical protein